MLSAVTDSLMPVLADGGDFLTRLFFRHGADSEVGAGLTGSDALFMFIWWVSVFFFVLLMGLMLYFIIKYNRKPGVAAPRSPSHNTLLEITWSVVPTLILVVIFFWGFDGYIKAQMPRGDAEPIDLRGYKWGWEMTYGNGAQSAETVPMGSGIAPVFYVPAGKPVLLKMNSSDVIHSFWVPDFRTKLDVMPNRYTPYSFTAQVLDPADPRVKVGDLTKGGVTREGASYRDHWIFCAEYCGDSHSEMAAVLRVVDPETYEWWKLTPNYNEANPPVEVGQIVYKAKGCATCHSVDGSDGTGPTWLNAYGRPVSFADGSAITQEEIDANPLRWDDYLRESILNPTARIHAGYAPAMPSYDGRLSDVELRGLIAYIRSLSGQNIDTTNIPGFEGLAAPAPSSN
jgi:cytochrome c oxidase subunit 2